MANSYGLSAVEMEAGHKGQLHNIQLYLKFHYYYYLFIFYNEAV